MLRMFLVNVKMEITYTNIWPHIIPKLSLQNRKLNANHNLFDISQLSRINIT